ncbi:phosphoglycerate kinase [Candidatus Woesearchaeota archaeon]|nr:phosphoglycerate kinase [Candidatus Woesearchaeota archaeon]
MMDVPTLTDRDFTDKRVLMRVGFDLPLDEHGNITDDKRIQVSLPSINYVLDHGAKQLVLMCHLGRPKNKEPHLRTDKVAERLRELLDREVVKVDDWGEHGLPDKRVVFLENLRFHPGEKSKNPEERDAFGKQLASLADRYVNDAFSNCHRDHASMTSVPKYIHGCIGASVAKEVRLIESCLEHPQKPVVAVIGGLKADKLNAMKHLLGIADKIVVGGALAFTLLKASGYEVGNSKVDVEGLEELKDIVAEVMNNPKVLLPLDAVVADKFDAQAKSKTVPIQGIEPGWMALDIGPQTVQLYQEQLKTAKTILWFGPIGVFEMEKFAQGTREIAQTIAQLKVTSIIGGGDSANAVHSLGLEDKMTLVSTGGGASLTLVEGNTLPALEVLKYKA